MAQGRFRQDLFYRVNAFPICLPALRERPDDIPLLAEALLGRVAPERKLKLADDALACLQAYDYPGNVRELRNILERASLMCDGDTVQRRHLPEELCEPGRVQAATPTPRLAGPDTPRELSDAELASLLRSYRGSRKALAAELGLSERTLYRRIKALS